MTNKSIVQKQIYSRSSHINKEMKQNKNKRNYISQTTTNKKFNEKKKIKKTNGDVHRHLSFQADKNAFFFSSSLV